MDEFDAKKMIATLQSMDNTGRKFARQALREGARVQAAAAKGKAPQDTGTTANAIKVRAMKRSTLRIGVISGISRVSFPHNFYASFVELGAKRGSKGSGGINARHWMKYAFQATKESAQQTIINQLNILISAYKGELYDSE